MARPVIDIRQVRRNFSCHASEYDRHARVQKRVAARLLQVLREEEPPQGPVLELGTGTGEAARRLVDSWPGLPLVVSDIAHGMTRHAAGTLPGTWAVDADAQALPFGNARFGLILSSSVFQWLNDLPAALAESRRALRPGGLIAFAMYGRETLRELREAHRMALAEAGAARSTHVHRFPGEEEVRAALAGAGLERLRLFSEEEREWHADALALMRSLKKIGAQNAAVSRPSGLSSRRTLQRLARLYAERFGRGAAVPATYHVIYALARRPR